MILASSIAEPSITLSVTDLRSLISHGSMTNDSVLSLYLTTLQHSYPTTKFLHPQFSSILLHHGWEDAQKFFLTDTRRHSNRTNARPKLSGEPVILIPFFINSSHWVAVARREHCGQVYFLYSDDTNDPTIERAIKQALQNTCNTFFPRSAEWISCHNSTYHPHSNECGPRTLIALTIMALHPHPSSSILLPWMHPNLSNISRTWVAATIVGNQLPPISFHHTTCDQPFQQRATSNPSSLIDWSQTTSPHLSTNLQHDGPAAVSSQHRLKAASRGKGTSPYPVPKQTPLLPGQLRLAPLGKATHPQPSTHPLSKVSPAVSQPHSLYGSSKTLPLGEQAPKHQKKSSGPVSKRTQVLPGQLRLTPFLSTTQEQSKIPKGTLENPVQSPHAPPIPHPISTSSKDKDSLPNPTKTTARINKNKTKLKNAHPQKVPSTPRPPPTLYDFSFFHPHGEKTENNPDTWGHVPEQIDTTTTLRILLQNPNGIKPSVTEPDFLFSLHMCSEIGIGVISLAETNVNWHQSQHLFSTKRCFHKTWSTSKFQTSISHESFLSSYQPGGTLTALTDKWTSRVITSGSDPFGLGRWSYVLLRGNKDNKICIITAYRPCLSRQTGPKTCYQQQLRQLSQLFREHKIPGTPEPHRQFIFDLQSWIESLQSQNISIILSLDNNEELQPKSGQLHPLESKAPVPTYAPQHDGTLDTLMRSTGLIDTLAMHHPSPSYPPTYIRGKKRLDYILVSASLRTSVLRSGILPYNAVFQGDHRPCFIDIDSTIAFQGVTHDIAPPCRRSLQLRDPRIVDRYNACLNNQLAQHKVLQKLETLKNATLTGTWTAGNTQQYESLDQLITDCMLHAERTACRRYTKKFDWSPTLIQAVQAERFWKLRLKQAKGLPVSESTLSRLLSAAKISQLPPLLTLSATQQCLQAARQTRRTLQGDHRILRQNYLTGLAEAIVLKRADYLHDPKYSKRLSTRTEKEVKRLIRKEQKLYLYKVIGRQLNDASSNSGGLTHIDIPAVDLSSAPQDLPDPKTWKGPWRAITDPLDISAHVSVANVRQYNQAVTTPFGSGYLAHHIGLDAKGPGSLDILAGESTTIASPTPLLPETMAIIKFLTHPSDHHFLPIKTQISPEEFKRTYKIVKEKTSSSISGRHVGHYKAASQDDALSSIHSLMMSLPYMVGFSPTRWQRIVDVMLEKDFGSPKVHRLRIIALIESDYNQSQRILVSRVLTHRIEDHNLVPDMQYGSRPGKLCISPVLNKQLTHDIIRQTKSTTAIIENDAVGCYDRLMNPLILLSIRQLGAPETITDCLSATWASTKHFIKTQFGVSKTFYTSTPTTPLFGPGQGSTTGPFFWQLLYMMIVACLPWVLTLMHFVSVSRTITVRNKGESFVDDSNLGSSSTHRSPQNLITASDQKQHAISAVANLRRLAQSWERLLYSTGGAINFLKSFWFLFMWQWSQGRARLVPLSRHTLQLTEGGRVDHPMDVPQISVNSTYRTLGVHISPSGSTKDAEKVLLEKALDYSTKVAVSSFTREAALMSYKQYFLPRVGYPLPAMTLTETSCRKIQSPTLMAVLPKLHLNRNIARNIVFGPLQYGGLALPSLYGHQCIGQIMLFLGHLRARDKTSSLLLVSLSYLQLLSGSSTSVLQLPYHTYAKWIEKGWLTSLWQFLSRSKLCINVTQEWCPKVSRTHDIMLMDYFVSQGFPAGTLGILNRCRIYLQILTLSDMVSADGTKIIHDCLQGIMHSARCSKLAWPIQQRPPNADWTVWSNALYPLHSRCRLHQRLGAWTTVDHHQEWLCLMDPITSALYIKEPSTDQWHSHTPLTHSSKRITRATATQYYDLRQPNASPLPSTHLLPTSLYKGRCIDLVTSHPGPAFLNASPTSGSTNSSQSQERQEHPFEVYFPPPSDSYPSEIPRIKHTIAAEATYVTVYSIFDTSLCLTAYGFAIYTDSEAIWQQTHAFSAPSEWSNSLRASCIGLLASLHLLLQVSHGETSLSGPLTLFLNGGKLLKLIKQNTYGSVKLALNPEADLLYEIQRNLRTLRATLKVQLDRVPASSDTESNPHITAFANLQTAVNHLSSSAETQPPYVDKYIPPPGEEATVYHSGVPVLREIHTLISTSLHEANIQATICSREAWAASALHLVNWDAIGVAFRRMRSCRRVTFTKLSHNLINTNAQNEKFYGSDGQCPCCADAKETLSHLLTCPAPSVQAYRQTRQSLLWKELEVIGTPDSILHSIKHGLLAWETNALSHSPTVGSLCPVDTLLSAAYYEQTHTLGWEPFLRGRVSLLWSHAYSQYLGADVHGKASLPWASDLVQLLLNYTLSLWKFRNQVVHGQDAHHATTLEKEQLASQIQLAHQTFAADPFIISSQWRHLFNRSPTTIIRADIDTMRCWLRSWQEALQQQQYYAERQPIKITDFFAKRVPRTRPSPGKVNSWESDVTNPTLDDGSTYSIETKYYSLPSPRPTRSSSLTDSDPTVLTGPPVRRDSVSSCDSTSSSITMDSDIDWTTSITAPSLSISTQNLPDRVGFPTSHHGTRRPGFPMPLGPDPPHDSSDT